MALSAFAFVQSCDYDDAADIAKVELGAPGKEIVVNASDTTFNVPILSNAKYHYELMEGAESWLHITGEPTETDSNLTLYCEPNNEFKRKGIIYLISDVDSRKDSIVVKQRG